MGCGGFIYRGEIMRRDLRDEGMRVLESRSTTDLTRRELVKLAASVAVGMTISGCRSNSGSRELKPSALADPIYYSSATAIAAAIREKNISDRKSVV